MEYINCAWCGQQVLKKNKLHKFCSNPCKKKHWRANNGKPEFPSFINDKSEITNQSLSEAQEQKKSFLENAYKKALIKEKQTEGKLTEEIFIRNNIPKKIVLPGKKKPQASIEDKKDKFDLIMDRLIEKDRKKMQSYGIYKNKQIEAILYDEIGKNRIKVRKAVKRLNNALYKEEMKYNKEPESIRKSKKEIKRIISKKRKEREQEIQFIMNSKLFDLL